MSVLSLPHKVDLVKQQFDKHFADILSLADRLSQLCMERELKFVLKTVEVQLQSASSGDEVMQIVEGFPRMLDFGVDDQKFAGMEELIRQKAQAVASRPMQIAQEKTEYFLLHMKIKNEVAGSLEELMEMCDAELLFSFQFRPEDMLLVEGLVKDALRAQSEPVLCRRQDARALVQEQLEMVHRALLDERCRRFNTALSGALVARVTLISLDHQGGTSQKLRLETICHDNQ